MEYLDQNEDFTCLWSLTGMIADEDSDSLFQAISFYRMQLEEEDRLGHPEDKKFQGFIYYKMGRYYEKIERPILFLRCQKSKVIVVEQQILIRIYYGQFFQSCKNTLRKPAAKR